MTSQDTIMPCQGEVEYEIISPNAQALGEDTKANTNNTNEKGAKDGQEAVELQLLQMAQNAIDPTVQISSGQLASLLASLADLRGQVAMMNTNAQALVNQLSVVTGCLRNIEQRHGCIEFRLFPKLPQELRCMIWQLALAMPRVLGLLQAPQRYRPKSTVPQFSLWDHTSTSIHPQVRYVCQESRAEALKAEYPFMKPVHGGRSSIICSRAVDTFFFITDDQSFGMVALLEEFDMCSPVINPHIAKLACRYMYSDEILDDDAKYFGLSLQRLSKVRTEELILVVGSEEACHEPGLVFAAPRLSPGQMLSEKYLDKIRIRIGVNASQEISWKQLDDHQLSRLQQHTQYVYRRRQDLLNQGLDPGYDEENDHWLENESTWTLKKVKYMEATTAAALKAAASV